MAKLIWDWHCHDDILLEPRIGTRKKRVYFIKRHKPQSEVPLRLRLYKRVKGKLPDKLVKAGASYEKAGASYDKAWAAYKKAGDKAGASYEKAWASYDKAWAAYWKVVKACMPEILKLHAKECPNCPWDGETIFPEEAAK